MQWHQSDGSGVKDANALCAVVTTAHRQEKHIHAEALRERQRDGDRAALAGEVRCLLVHGLDEGTLRARNNAVQA